MPASADIYGLVGRGVQQPQDPLNTLAKTLQIQEMQQLGQDRALKQDEYRRGVEQKNKLMQLLGGEYADDEERASALLRGGFLKESQDYLKGRSDLRKTNADVAKTGAETDAKRLEVASKKLDIAGQAMGYVKDNPSVESAKAAIQHLVSNGIWDQTQAEQAMARVMADQSPEGIRKLATMAYQSALSAKDQLPNFVQQNRGGTVATQRINPITGVVADVQSANVTESEAQRLARERAAADAAAGRAVQIRGQNMTDARSRESNAAAMSKPFEVTGPDGNPLLVQQDKQGNIVPVQGYKPKGGAEKPLNDAQSKALLFGSRMRESDKVLGELAKAGTLASVPGSRSGFGVGPVINALSSSKQQQLDQAKRDFVNAVLRRESGAVIADSEFENADKQYFPQIGDSREVIAQKARNRQLAIDGILAEVPENRRESLKPQPALPTADDVRRQADAILKGG